MDKLEQYLAEMGHIIESDSRLLRQIAYERLHAAINHAHLEPEERRSETRISNECESSRTQVPEALQQLVQDGLLQVIPGLAITVASPSIQEVLDALHVRELLEPELVRLAAEALPEEALKHLRVLTEEMERAARAGDRP